MVIGTGSNRDGKFMVYSSEMKVPHVDKFDPDLNYYPKYCSTALIGKELEKQEKEVDRQLNDIYVHEIDRAVKKMHNHGY
jgi:hypothetical protein